MSFVYPSTPGFITGGLGQVCSYLTEELSKEIYSTRQNPDSPYSGVITKFVERAKAGKPPIIFGDGSQTRDFVSVHDVVFAAVKCIQNDDAVGEVFNIGTGVATTINQLSMLCSGREPEYKAAVSGDIRESYADISKAREKIGYDPCYDLKSGLMELL